MSSLSLIDPEVEATEDAAAYDAWYRARAQKAVAGTEPGIPHDQVMAEMRALIDARRSTAPDRAC